MPKLSDSMTEGTIVAWLKSSGELVTRGEEIVEIETDKAIVAYAVEAGGVLEILAPVGATLPLGAAIARIGVRAAGASSILQPSSAPTTPRTHSFRGLQADSSPPERIVNTTAVRSQST